MPKHTANDDAATRSTENKPTQIDIITLFPDLFSACNYGIVGRACQRNIMQINCWNPRDYADNQHGYVDDKPYGGGPGMVMQAPPLAKAIDAAKQAGPAQTKPWVVYLSPQGPRLDQDKVIALSQAPQLILLCGRYEGVDQRLIDHEVDEQCSIGDYVLSGGEYAALVLIDAITRWLPNALGDPESREQESFYPDRHLLDYPHYTRPADWKGLTVPKVLLSGNHADITAWRQQEAKANTARQRPDLINAAQNERATQQEPDLPTDHL